MKTFFDTAKRNDLRYAVFMTFYIMAAIVVSVCGVLVTKLTGEISQAALEFDVDVIVRFLAVMAIIIGVKAAAAAMSAYFTGRFSGKTEYNLRENFTRHFVYLHFADLEKKNSGSMLSIYANDLPQAASFMTDGSLNLIADIISVVASFIYMASINPAYTVIFFLMFPPLIFMQIKISGPIQKKVMEVSSAKADFNAIVNDSLQNVSTVIAYSLEDAMEERYLASYDKCYKASREYILALLKLVMGGIAASMLPILFVSVAAGFSVAANRMSVSEFIAFTTVSSTAGNWLSMLSQRLSTFRVTAAGAARLNDIMTIENIFGCGADTSSGTASFDDVDTAVRFENVSFSYGDGPLVLDNASFEIKKGTKTAIVGSSGSGKSTVLKLILALYRPNEGNVFISGRNVNDVSPEALRSRLAYVPQDSFMFPESIRENIIFTNQDGVNVDDEKLKKACADAGILSFINGLPDGFDSVLSESGENISGGQRQRIALARAFLQDAPIVLFDEATSALDPITEDDIMSSFGALMNDKTAVMVAHRLKAIAACDSLIVMDKGKIVGIGDHYELISGNSAYAALYESLRREEQERDGTDE